MKSKTVETTNHPNSTHGLATIAPVTCIVHSTNCSYSGGASCAQAFRFWPNPRVEYGWFMLSTVLHLYKALFINNEICLRWKSVFIFINNKVLSHQLKLEALFINNENKLSRTLINRGVATS